MATLTSSARDYCTLLAKSQLLPADEVEALHRRWKDETRGTDDQVESFRKFLVSRKHLTEYQSVMIRRGHAEGFFLNGYKILDRIGKGQMGGVYAAVDPSGWTVALKILSGSKAKDPHILGRFQREARLLTQLDHPNVVRAFQVGEADGVHYIAMEMLDGETLDEVLARRKKLPPGEAVRLVHQTLGGLQHLHERRMIHRDLKPSNLMLEGGKPDSTSGATVKILDIGLGREMFDEADADEPEPTQLTVEGAVLGTPDYLAPEQAKDASSADHRADVYSIGCVLYHALTGRPPFPDGNIMTQMLKHATEQPVPVAAFAPTAPPGLQAVIDRMMAKSPDERYPSAADAAAALAVFLMPNSASVEPAVEPWQATEPLGVPALRPPQPGTAVLPTVKPMPQPRPKPPPAPEVDEVEVELVPAFAPPMPLPVPLPAPPPQVIVREPEPRALWELDRRDLMMLGLGGLGVLTAVGLGYGLAKLVRKKPSGETE